VARLGGRACCHVAAFSTGRSALSWASTTSHQAAAQTPAIQPARKRLMVDAQVHVWKAESKDDDSAIDAGIIRVCAVSRRLQKQ